jgi:hypothetical protein
MTDPKPAGIVLTDALELPRARGAQSEPCLGCGAPATKRIDAGGFADTHDWICSVCGRPWEGGGQ